MTHKTTMLGIALVFLPAMQAKAQQELPPMFNGIWASVNPPGPHVTFTRTGLHTVDASLPVLGQSQLRVSNGEGGSNLKASGQGFDCYYFYSPINPRKMVWDWRSGDSTCPPSMAFEKDPPN